VAGRTAHPACRPETAATAPACQSCCRSCRSPSLDDRLPGPTRNGRQAALRIKPRWITLPSSGSNLVGKDCVCTPRRDASRLTERTGTRRSIRRRRAASAFGSPESDTSRRSVQEDDHDLNGKNLAGTDPRRRGTVARRRAVQAGSDPVLNCQADKVAAAGNSGGLPGRRAGQSARGRQIKSRQLRGCLRRRTRQGGQRRGEEGGEVPVRGQRDGTISDLNTLLMWEKKDASFPERARLAGYVHLGRGVRVGGQPRAGADDIRPYIDARKLRRAKGLALADDSELTPIRDTSDSCVAALRRPRVSTSSSETAWTALLPGATGRRRHSKRPPCRPG